MIVPRTEKESISVNVEDRIAWVQCDRPERRHCMNPSVNRRMLSVLDELAYREDVGVLVLSGASDAWSVGMNLKEYFLETEALGLVATRKVQSEAYGWWRRLRGFEKPTIAMVNGRCFGGGYGPLYACDLAFSADEASFATYEAPSGETIDGRTAAARKMVNESVPLMGLRDRVRAVAKRLLEKDLAALQAAKDLMRRVSQMTYDSAEDYLLRAQEAANTAV